MGFGTATNGASDISEIVQFLGKIDEANITDANSVHPKEGVRHPANWQQDSQPWLPQQECMWWVARKAEPGNSETLEAIKSKKQLCRHEACGPQSGTESKTLNSHIKTSASSLSIWPYFQPTTQNTFFFGFHWRPQPAILCWLIAFQGLPETVDI